MGRIVIPRYQRQRAQLKQRPKGSGYFANGFGPQEMSLISKLTDLAVAGGGQIARAVQISNREEEQAEAQADYDRRLQSETQAAAREELEALDAPMSTTDAFFADMPIAGLAEPLYNKPYRETLGVSGQPATPQRGLYADQSLGALTQPRGMGTGIISRPGSFAPEDVARSAEFERNLLSATLEDAVDTFQKRTGEDRVNTDPISRPHDRAAVMQEAIRQGIPSPASVQMSLPEFAQAQQAAQRFAPGEEERAAMRAQIMERAQQEALQAVGPAPERKLFRIADILAAAPSARTEEQRAMLLQAAVDSPDIQAANLSDLAKGAYRDRAMQAVMKLFPEEEEALSEYELLRMQSMRESMETENLRQQKLQAALDKEAAKLSRQAKRGGGTGKSRELMEQAAYLTKNYPKWKAGEIDPERWRFNTGPFWSSTPSSLAIDGQNAGLRGSNLKALRSAESRMLSSERTAQAGDRIQLTKERLENAKLRAKSTRDNAARRYNLDVQKFQARADARAAEKSYLAKLQGDLSTEEKRLAAEDYAADMNRLASDAAGLDAPAQRSGVDAVVEAQREELERRKKARKEGE